jgi:hypothetical protein
MDTSMSGRVDILTSSHEVVGNDETECMIDGTSGQLIGSDKEGCDGESRCIGARKV